jgi:Arc/MetJ-type ribon-helix-helix transcriptional regulator
MTLQIDLPDDVRRLADEQIASGRFASLSEYLATLIREDQNRFDERVRDVLRARLQSGPGTEMADAAFDAIRNRLDAEIARRRGA